MVQGETGTGKERAAEAIHRLSRRSKGPFVVVDCGALPPNLIASELFGHERGAFTGADRRHLGAFERARGGTLFLDEIGELPLELQPVLLGGLERRRFRRVGGTHEVDADVRVVSATNRDLREAVNDGTFRADLYFRLAVTRIRLPALRDRPDDIEPLVRHFLRELGGESPTLELDAAQLDALQLHPWQGNVRELRNVVESALALGRLSLPSPPTPVDPTPTTLPPPPPTGVRPVFDWIHRDGDPTTFISYREARQQAIRRFERTYLGRLMETCAGNASEASRRASMDRPYLLRLLRRHELR